MNLIYNYIISKNPYFGKKRPRVGGAGAKSSELKRAEGQGDNKLNHEREGE